MAHIPREDVQEFWSETNEKSWSGLSRTLESHIDESEGNTEVKMMIQMADDMDNSGQPFPQNVDELYNLINENVNAEREADF